MSKKKKIIDDMRAELKRLDEMYQKYPKEIFSGEYSKPMWDDINNAKTIKDLRLALYFVCCRLQELEDKYDRKEALRKKKAKQNERKKQ